MEDIFKFKHKGNRVQFEFNNQILQIVQNLWSALNDDDPREADNLCNNLAAKLKCRNTLIKMTDRSPLGWDTVVQLLATQMMEKRLEKPRTRQLPNRKVKSLTNLPFAFLFRD